MKKNIIIVILTTLAIICTCLLVAFHLQPSIVKEYTKASKGPSGLGSQDEIISNWIGTSIIENGNTISYRNYDAEKDDGSWIEAEGELFTEIASNFKPGQVYNESIKIKNTGLINTFNKVSIRKYWEDEEGNKVIGNPELSTDLIEIGFSMDNDWLIDEYNSTNDNTIALYRRCMTPNDEVEFITSIRINPSIDSKFDGYKFVVEITDDAVQQSGGEEGIKEAWDLDVEIENDDYIERIVYSPLVLTLTANPNTNPTNSHEITYTFTFNKPIEEETFTEEDINVINGTKGTLTKISDTEYTMTVTELTNGTHSIEILAKSVFDSEGNGNKYVSYSTVVDITAPIATITANPDENPTNTDEITYTITFNEPINGEITEGDINVTNGTIEEITKVNDTTYTVTVTGITEGEHSIEIPANVVTDEAGNGNEEVTHSTVIDTTAPTVTITADPDTNPTNTDEITYTITFSEPIEEGTFTAEDVNVTNGTIESITKVNDTTYTVVVTEIADGEHEIQIPTNAVTDLAGNGNESASYNTIVDTTELTVEIIANPNGNPTNADEITYTITFSKETQETLTADGINVTNGTIENITKVNDTTYTVTVTGITEGTHTLEIPANAVTDNVGNGNTAVSYTTTVDQTEPSVTITANPNSNPTNASEIAYTFTFSEPIADGTFTADDVNVTNGTKGTLTKVSDTEYTMTVAGITDGTHTVTVPENAVTDNVGNGNTAGSYTTTIDQTAPSVTITANPNANPTNASSIEYTFTFSEEIPDGTFTTEDINVTNGTKGELTKVNDTTYTMTVTELTDGAHTLEIPANAVTDNAGNGNTSASYNTVIETSAPNLSITANPDGNPTNATSIEYTFTFSKAIANGTFTASDVTVSTGTKGTLNKTSDKVYTMTVTAIPEGAHSIEVPANVATDNAGNGNTPGSYSTVIDRTTPTATITVTPNDNPTNATEITYTITFSEPVEGTITADDINVTNGTVGTITKVSDTEYTIVITEITEGTHTVEIPANTVTDEAGNGNTAVSNTITVDHTAPTATITAEPNGNPTNANEITYTITFSEPVEGTITAENINVTNGTVGTVTKVSDTEYTITVTGITEGTHTIEIPANTVTDEAGNGNTAGSYSTNVDQTAPTLNITAEPSGNPTNVNEITYTFTFSEPIADGTFTANDVTVTNGTKGELTKVNDTTYTMTVTGIAGGTHSVEVAANTVTDKAGNGNTAGSYTTAVDKTAPTLNITAEPSGNPTNATSIEYTFTFSEPIAEGTFTAEDVTVTNGTAGELTKVNDTTYTMTVTEITGGIHSVEVAANTVTDSVGNGNTAGSYSTTIDQTAPTVEITANPNDNPTNANEITYTFTFSEEITEGTFTADDVIVTNGTKGTLNKTSDTEYTMTVTGITEGTHSIELPANAVTDKAGNGNEAVSNSITIDQTAPSVAITAVPSKNPTNASSIEYTFTFSEAIADGSFTADDINVTNGTKGELTKVGDAIYTMTVTEITEGTHSIELPANAVTDVAGNGNTAGSYSTTIDQTAPTVSTINVTSPEAGTCVADQVVTIVATFSEDVYASDGSALTAQTAPELKIKVGDGEEKTATFSGVSGNTITYTYTIASGDDGALSTYSYTGNVYDLAGNQGTVENKTIGGNAIYAIVDYTITYNLDGGINNANNPATYTSQSGDIVLGEPTKSQYVFKGWTGSNGETPQKSVTITSGSKGNKEYTANWELGVAVFKPGQDVNAIMKQLASNDSNKTHTDTDTSITAIRRAETLTAGTTTRVSTDESTIPIEMWYDNGTIWYYTEASNPKLNRFSENWCGRLTNLNNVELSSWDTSNVEYYDHMFEGSTSLTTLDLSNFNTNSARYMQYVFKGCSGLTSLNVTSFNTAGVRYFDNMFEGCSGLTELNVSNFNTTSAITMGNMFYGCSGLTTLDLSNFNTTSAIQMNSMFRDCSGLTSLNISSFFTNFVTRMEYMFYGCSSLTSLDISSFKMNSISNTSSLNYMLDGMTSLIELKTPDVYPTNSSRRINLPKKLYDPSLNGYTSINNTSPTKTWLKVAYTVSFNSNTGTGTMPNQVIFRGVDTNLSTNTFTKDGYEFKGWAESASGAVVYTDGQSVNNLTDENTTKTLYAVWRDITAPTVTITANPDGNLTNASEITYTFTFSEPIDDGTFTTEDINVTNGTIGTITKVDDTTYTVTITGITEGIHIVEIPENAITDGEGNGNEAVSNSVTIDQTAPTVTITAEPDRNPTNADEITYTITFSEPIDGEITENDINVTNGTIENITKVKDTTYTVTVTEITEGTHSVEVAANTVTDNAGNGNEAVSNSVTIDQTAPTVAIASNPSENPTNANEITYTFTFSEPIADGTFTGDDVNVTNGTKGELTKVDDTTYTITVTGITEGTHSVEVAANTVTDNAGNGNTAKSYTTIVDQTAPTVEITANPNANPTNVDEITYTFTFSEEIPDGTFTTEDVSVANGTKGELTKVSDTVYTMTVTGITEGTHTIEVLANAVSDEAGNGNTAGSYSTLIDQTSPSVLITAVPSDNPTNANQITYTFTFSEPIAEGTLTIDDFNITNGIIEELTKESNTTYTVVVTGLVDGTHSIGLPANSVTDNAGNGNTAGSYSTVIETVAPTLSITAEPNTNPTNANEITYTFTFSKPIANGTFTAEDITVSTGTKGTLTKTSNTVYTMTVTEIPDGTHSIEVIANACTDTAGNGNTADSYSTVVDTTAPSVTITANPSSNPTNVNSIEYTFTFSEEIEDGTFTAEDVNVTNGTIGELAKVSDTVYTMTVTGITDGTHDIVLSANKVTDLAGNGNTAGNYNTTIDQTAPIITITANPNENPTNANEITYTITFNEPIEDGEFTTEDINVTNGTIGEITKVDDTTYTVTVTEIIEGEHKVEIPANAITDGAGNGNEAVSKTTEIDTTEPTVTITANPNANPTNANSIEYTFTFSELIADGTFTTEDVNVTNGTKGELTKVTDTVYTMTVTGIQEGTHGVEVPANVLTDIAGNANTAGSYSTIVDQTAPSVIITANPNANPTNANSIEYTFTFSEAIADGTFTADDVNVTNGTIGELTKISDTVYTMTVTEIGEGNHGVFVAANSATDLVGNGNTAGNYNTIIDRTLPTVTITAEPNDDLTNVDEITYTVTFSEDIEGTLTAEEINVTNGTIESITKVDDTTYTIIVTEITDGEHTIEIPANVITDDAGNGNTAGSYSITVDQTAPSVIITASPNENPTNVNEITYTITFSEAIEDGTFIADDVNVTNGTKGELTKVNDTTYTITITGITDGTHGIEVPANTVTDLAGNGNTAGSYTTIVDQTVPTLTITAEPGNNPTNANEITYTFTFSEKPADGTFTGEDVNVTNGTKGELTKVDDTTYTMTVTGVVEGTHAITVPANACTDDAGNGNTAGSYSTVVDTTAPSVTIIANPNGNPTNVSSIEYTFIFSEEIVEGTFTAEDVNVTNGTKGTLTKINDTTYKMTVTGITEGTHTLEIPANVVNDKAGNGNTAGNYSTLIDKTVPNVTITAVPSDNPTNTSEITYTFTFSEEIADGTFTTDDLNITNGIIEELTKVNGITYTAVATGFVDGTHSIELPANSVTDKAGNGNTAGNYSTVIETLAPTLSITAEPNGNPINSNSIQYTFTFSKAIKDGTFTASDVNVTNGTKGALNKTSSTVYTITVSGITEGTHSVEVFANACTDDAGNGNTADSYSTVVDTVAPTVTITPNPNSNPTNVSSIAYTFTFSEAPADGTFTASDVIAVNGTKGELTKVSDTEYTMTVSNLIDGPHSVSINANAVTDPAGNENTAVSYNTTVDQTVPTVTITPVPNANPTNTNSIAYTITFSEVVNGTITAENINVVNGTKGNVTKVNDTTYTMTVTGIAEGTHSLELPANVVTDLAGNGNTAGSYNTVVDQTAPSVTITANPNTNPTTVNEIAYTITLSEEVNRDLTAEDITVSTGTKGTLTKTSNTVYTINVTDIPDGAHTITVPANTVTDAAGNGNTAGSYSTVVDQTGPSVEITAVPNGDIINSNQIAYTFTFDEEITDGTFTTEDIIVSTGTKGELTKTSNTVYTMTVTGIPDGEHEIEIPDDVVTDIAGNGNTADNYETVVDTVAPTVEITADPDENPTNTDEITYTFTFSEEISEGSFTAEDIIVTNGTKGELTPKEIINIIPGEEGQEDQYEYLTDYTTYTMTITQIAEGTHSIEVPANAVTDLAGNGNPSASYSTIVDRTGPTITSAEAKEMNNTAKSGLALHLNGNYNTGSGFDENETEWADVSGNNRVGDIYGATWVQDETNGNSLHFDGVDDYVDLGVINSEFQAVEATFSVDSVTSEYDRMVISNVQAGGIDIFVDPSGKIRGGLYIDPSAYVNQDSNVTVEAGRKYTVCCSFDGNTAKLYVDGVLTTSIQKAGAFIKEPNRKNDEDTMIVLGANPGGKELDTNGFLLGNIYDAKIYRRGLTDEEILQNYNSQYTNKIGISATVTSEGSEISEYLISTDPNITQETADSETWNEIEPTSTLNIDSVLVEEGEDHFVYIKDTAGNITKSKALNIIKSITTTEDMIEKNGIQVNLNAINNTGSGHDNEVNTWKDLSNNSEYTLNGGGWTSNSLHFNGFEEWVNLGVKNNTDYITMEATFRPEDISSSSTQCVLGNWESGGGGLLLENGNISCQLYVNGAWKTIRSQMIADTTSAYTASLTYDGSVVKLYVNGELKGSVSATGTIGVPQNDTVLALGVNPSGSGIGASGSGTGIFAGEIYTARLYGRALTQAQITNNYKADMANIDKYVDGISQIKYTTTFDTDITSIDESKITATNAQITNTELIADNILESTLNVTGTTGSNIGYTIQQGAAKRETQNLYYTNTPVNRNLMIAANNNTTAPILTVTPSSSSTPAKTVEVIIKTTNRGRTNMPYEQANYQYFLSTSATPTSVGTLKNYNNGISTNIGSGLTGTYYLFVKQIINTANQGTSSTNQVTIGGVVYHRYGAYKFQAATPEVTFGTNGETTYRQSQSSKVTVTTNGATINERKYQWTNSTTEPAANTFSSTFNSGDNVSGSGYTGTYYLWIYIKYTTGGNTYTLIVRSNAFKFDNTKPTISATATPRSASAFKLTLKLADTGGAGIAGYYVSTSSTTPSSSSFIALTNPNHQQGKADSLTKDITTVGGNNIVENTTYYLWSKDKAGNISSRGSVTTSNIYYSTSKSGTTTTYHSTLNEAYKVCESSGSTITVLKNNTDGTSASFSKNLTLNLNGKTLTRTAAIYANEGYTVTVNGAGTLNNSTTQIFVNRGTLNITNGTYNQTGDGHVINNDGGKLNITNGTFKNNKTNGTSGNIISNKEESTATITTGAFETNKATTGIVNAGTLTIKGGTFTKNAGNGNVINGQIGTMTITGGTFTNKGPHAVISNGNDYTNPATCTISNATVKVGSGGSGSAVINYVGTCTINSGTYSSTSNTTISVQDGTMNIKGGTITSTAGNTVNTWPGSKIYISGGTYNSYRHGLANAGQCKISGGTFNGATADVIGGVEQDFTTIANGLKNDQQYGLLWITGGTIKATQGGSPITNYSNQKWPLTSNSNYIHSVNTTYNDKAYCSIHVEGNAKLINTNTTQGQGIYVDSLTSGGVYVNLNNNGSSGGYIRLYDTGTNDGSRGCLCMNSDYSSSRLAMRNGTLYSTKSQWYHIYSTSKGTIGISKDVTKKTSYP